MKSTLIVIFLLASFNVYAETSTQKYIDDDGVIHIGGRGERGVKSSSRTSLPGSSATVIRKTDQPPARPEEADCVVNQLFVKELEYKPATVIVSFKADVQNYGSPGSCSVYIQGVDNNGFEILYHILRDNIDLNGVKSFSETRYFDTDKYASVREWKVKKISNSSLRN